MCLTSQHDGWNFNTCKTIQVKATKQYVQEPGLNELTNVGSIIMCFITKRLKFNKALSNRKKTRQPSKPSLIQPLVLVLTFNRVPRAEKNIRIIFNPEITIQKSDLEQVFLACRVSSLILLCLAPKKPLIGCPDSLVPGCHSFSNEESCDTCVTFKWKL